MTLYNGHNLVLTIAGIAFLAGCSYVPDKLNPIEWANTGYDWLIGEDDYYDAELNLRETSKQERDVTDLPTCQGSDVSKWHNCEAFYLFRSGAHYLGKWANGKRTGPGTFTWSDGEKYVGEFKDGIQNGQGTVYFPDGEVWIGQFRDGKWVSGEKYAAGETPPAR